MAPVDFVLLASLVGSFALLVTVVLAVAGSFDDAMAVVKTLGEDGTVTVVNSISPALFCGADGADAVIIGFDHIPGLGDAAGGDIGFGIPPWRPGGRIWRAGCPYCGSRRRYCHPGR